MAKQINQYTKTRTSSTIQNDDYLDLDSTEDGGTTFESAKLKFSELLTKISNSISNIYNSNGTISSNRTLTANGNETRFLGGNVAVKMNNTVDDYGFHVLNNKDEKSKAVLIYDQSENSALLELSNENSVFLRAFNSYVELLAENSSALATEKQSIVSLGASHWNGSQNIDTKTEIITAHENGLTYTQFLVDGQKVLRLSRNGTLRAENLPTSTSGLTAGDIWNNAGVLNIFV